MEGVLIRAARPEELPLLDALVLRSKSHWVGVVWRTSPM